MHNRAVCRWVEWELFSVQFLLLPFWLKRNTARNFERCFDVASVLCMTMVLLGARSWRKRGWGAPREVLPKLEVGQSKYDQNMTKIVGEARYSLACTQDSKRRTTISPRRGNLCR